jgi:hypothetical protein
MRKSLISTLALLAITALAIPAISATISKKVTFEQKVSVNGTQVNAGDYRVTVDGNSVKIEKGHDVVVQTQGQLEQRNEKFQETAVIFDSTGTVKEIQFAGSNEAVVFGGGAAPSGQK